jgi:hypothetical protein
MRDTRTLADWRNYRCRWCSQEFRRTARHGRKPNFCSDACREEFWSRVRITEKTAFRAGAARGVAANRQMPKKPLFNQSATPRILGVEGLVFLWRVELRAGPEREVTSPDGVRCFVSKICDAPATRRQHKPRRPAAGT